MLCQIDDPGAGGWYHRDGFGDKIPPLYGASAVISGLAVNGSNAWDHPREPGR